MAKNRKIKTYRHIYSESGRGLFSAGGLLSAILVLALAPAAGWYAYGPVYRFVMGMNEAVTSQPLPDVSAPASASSGAAESPQAAPIASEAPPAPVSSEPMKAAYMPPQFAADLGRAEAFLAALPAGEFNTVMVDLKDANGTLYYQTRVELAVAAGAVAPSSADADALAQLVREAGYRPATRIHAFSDRVLPAYDRSSAVLYMDTDWIWLDNTRELGGRPWLNPYSEVAQAYICDLAAELAESGFETVLVDSVHFPTGVGVERAGYGDAEQRTPRAEQLKAFMRRVADAVEGAGAHCAMYIPANAMLSPALPIYGGSPLDLYDGLLMVGMMPGSIYPGTDVGGHVLADPVSDPAGTVAALFGRIPEQAHGRVVAWLQGAAADGSPAAADFAEAQVRGIPPQGHGFVLYHPQGSYRP